MSEHSLHTEDQWNAHQEHVIEEVADGEVSSSTAGDAPAPFLQKLGKTNKLKENRKTIISFFIEFAVIGTMVGWSIAGSIMDWNSGKVLLAWCIVLNAFWLIHRVPAVKKAIVTVFSTIFGTIGKVCSKCHHAMPEGYQRRMTHTAYFLIFVALFIVFVVLMTVFSPSANSEKYRALAGLIFFPGVCWAVSYHPKRVSIRTVFGAFAFHFILACLVLRWEPGFQFFSSFSDAVSKFLGFAAEGEKFVFGESYTDHFFFMSVLPVIIFFSTFVSVFFFLGILQAGLAKIAWVFFKVMGTSGAETMVAVANICLGQSEAPLLVRPFINEMTLSELMVVMVAGFASASGSVLAGYIGMGISAQTLVTASVLSAPGSLFIAKIIYPEVDHPTTLGCLEVKEDESDRPANVLDAAGRGALQGLELMLAVAAILIAFVSIIAVFDAILTFAGNAIGVQELTFKKILGYIFTPFVFFTGTPMDDILSIAEIVGLKTAVNEFVAFQQLADIGAAGVISEKALRIASCAVCGFANFSSIGIMIGALGGMAKARQGDIARLAIRALLGGTCVSMVAGCYVAMLTE